MGRLWIAVAMVLGAGAGAGCASAGDAAPAHVEHTQEENQAAWMAYMTPGEPHAKMLSQCGTWDVVGKMWMEPDAPPTESKGVAEFSMLFGGRYQCQDFTGDFMGMPFQGHGVLAYDNALKKYVSLWLDSMGTGIAVTTGTMDATGKALTTTGEMNDPYGDLYKMRMVWTETGPEGMTVEMYMSGPEHPTEYRVMEMVYTKRKK
jgi:hypothetical protein